MSKLSPKISIITVTYNAKNVIQPTIGSVIDQTYSNIEYIIVDGSSTDGTVDIINKYREHVSKFISEPDKGIYDAMNKGLQAATGDFVWFMNAGDLIYNPDTLENVFSSADGIHADVIYGQTMVIGNDGQEIGLRRLKPGKNFTWRDYRFGQLISHQSFIARRELCPPYDLTYKCSADTDWQLKVLRKAVKLYNANCILSRFLDGGKSKQTIIPSLKERFQIMIKNYGIWVTIFSHITITVKFFWFLLLNRRF